MSVSDFGMDSEDRELWRTARTMLDLGEMTALWLEGKIASQPGYAPNTGPDEETGELIPALAAINRGAFVTNGSQPGLIEESGDGLVWKQRAAVEGFADEAAMSIIIRTIAGTALRTVVHDGAGWRTQLNRSVAVTMANDEGCTWFGARLSRRHIRFLYGVVCHRDAVRLLTRVFQVTVYDPEWGRNDVLWPALFRDPTHSMNSNAR